jgi:hypothetical protein
MNTLFWIKIIDCVQLELLTYTNNLGGTEVKRNYIWGHSNKRRSNTTGLRCALCRWRWAHAVWLVPDSPLVPYGALRPEVELPPSSELECPVSSELVLRPRSQMDRLGWHIYLLLKRGSCLVLKCRTDSCSKEQLGLSLRILQAGNANVHSA